MPTTDHRARYQIYSVATMLVGMGLLFFAILRATGGTFGYTLDDPYIHLSLAENIRHGHYGVNAQEFASPSSSIIYPLLLAIFLSLGFGDFAPLALNIIGAIGTAWLLSGLFWDAVHKSRTGLPSVVAYLAVPFLVVSVNGFALGFTGMEHTLHVFASVAIIAGLSQVNAATPPPVYLLIAIVAAPLLRFEGFALAGAALLALVFWGHWARAILTGSTIAVCVAAYMGTMAFLDLPVFPSSVLVKSSVTAAVSTSHFGAFFVEIYHTLSESLSDRQGVVLACGIVLLTLGAIRAKDRPQARTVAAVAIAAAFAHLLVGRWNWFSRYEIYIIATALAALFIVWGPHLSVASRRVTTPALAIFVFPVIGFTYIYVILLTPPAAQNIHDQQYQMHRFATEYFPEPVAVTDLGWVTYRNDGYVLDLWGLGSETARQLFQRDGRNPETVRQLTSDANVAYAMLYEEVFYDGLPPEWCRIAQLETVQTTATFATVEFFLIRLEREGDMRRALNAFAPSIPASASIVQFDCTSAADN